MSLRISIDDTGHELSVSLSASGSYNPDVLDDLTTRAVTTYREAMTVRLTNIVAGNTLITDGTTE